MPAIDRAMRPLVIHLPKAPQRSFTQTAALGPRRDRVAPSVPNAGGAPVRGFSLLAPPPKGRVQRAVDFVLLGNADHVHGVWGDLNLNEYHAIRAIMGRTPAGQAVLAAADRREISLHFTYANPSSASLNGVNLGTDAFIFLERTKYGRVFPLVRLHANGLEYTAAIAIHEGLHALGVQGSRRAEALVRLEELRCLGVRIDRQAMRQVLTDMRHAAVRGAYPDRHFRERRQTPRFPGLQF